MQDLNFKLILKLIAWILLNTLTLGLRETENNTRMKTSNLITFCNVKQMGPKQSDLNKKLIIVSMITNRSIYCIKKKLKEVTF